MRRAALALALAWGAVLAAQPQAPPAGPVQLPLEAVISAEPSGEAFPLTFFNRPITVLRARVLGRGPAERGASARRTLDDLVARGVTRPVETRLLGSAAIITIGGRGVLALTPADVDELSGESVPQAAAQAAVRLQQALAEADEARTPGRLLRSAALALTGLVAGLLSLAGIARAQRAAATKLVALAEESVARSGIADATLLRASRLIEFERRVVSAAAAALYLVIAYATVTFVLRRFPFTRPWGEMMSGFLVETAKNLGLGIAHAIPGLFTIIVILFMTRFVVRLIGSWFNAIERGRIAPPRWLHPETAQPTRRLLTAFAWLFAIVVVYPYVPGSQTDAFKGVSVLLGLMLTLGSSGLVTQIMSSFMITYSRALRVGDFVRVGDVEGTVTQLGMLSTKLKTVWSEEVTIPNALVISQTTTDYSRTIDPGGVFTPTSISIGYDSPWRQVHSLLLMAAARTPGLRPDVPPLVLQTALEDFYVRYTLLVCLEHQPSRPFTMADLHANVQDLFNEYGVQIMSPHHVIDPVTPKVVRKQDWFADPARVDVAGGVGTR